MNLIEYLTRSTQYMERHGIESPRLNAELLLGHMLDMERIELYTNFDRPLSEPEADRYREMVLKRANGYPLQYLTGKAGFRKIEVELLPGVFIPRPETEVLVEKALEIMGPGEIDVLDLCTGCGNIAVSVAVEYRSAKVCAVDIEPLALELCGRNARRNGVGDRVRTLPGDLFGGLGDGRGYEFDVVVSNPPYIPTEEIRSLQREVRDYEPVESIHGGPDGLEIAKRIIEGAPSYMGERGWLLLEIGEGQAQTVVRMLRGGWSEIEVFEDLAGFERVVRARLE